MSTELKNFFKIWVPTIALLCTLIGYGGKLISAVYGVSTDLRELKASVAQLTKDMSELKINAYTEGRENKEHEQKQADEIERLNVDVARLKVIARIATKYHNPLQPVTDHCSIYREALVCDEPKSRMSLN